MAEKQSSNPDLTGKMSTVESNIKSIFDARKNILTKLAEADKAGDVALAKQLADDSVTLSRALQRQESELDLLLEEREKPELERIGKLTEELRQPYVSPPVRGYSPYGLMPNAPNTTKNQNDFPTRQEQTQRKRELVGQLYNAPPSSPEAEQLPAGVRAGVGALPTPEGELEYLKRTYPNASIAPIDVAGKTEYLIKNPDGTSFTTLDKGVAGIAGMLAVEAPITVAEVGAGLGTLAATKSPVTATLAAGATRATVGPLADSITRAALGMPQQVGESFARRGTEAAIGTALGLGIDVIPPSIVAARMPSSFKNEFLGAYQNSIRELGLPETAVPAGAQFGKQGLETAQELSGMYPRSTIASNMRRTQESIRTIFNNVLKDIPANPNDFSSIAVNQEAQRRAFSNSVARANNQNIRIIDEAVEKTLRPPARTNIENLGGILRNTIVAAEEQAIKSTSQQYDVLADVADQAGFYTTAKDVLNMLPEIKARINPGGAFDEAAVSSVERDLIRQRDAPVRIYKAGEELKSVKKRLATLTKERLSGKKISKSRLNQIKANELQYQGQAQDLAKEIKELQNISGALDFKAFDGYIRRFNDARPQNAVGGTTTDVLGSGISKELSELRRNVYKKFNATSPDGTIRNLGDEFQIAADLVAQRNAFEGNTLGRILKEVVGEQATTTRDIVSSVMKEPFTINRVLQATKQLELDDPAQAGITNKLQEMMQLQYLNDLGMGGKKGVTLLNYDQGMLDSLYGNKAAAAARGLDSINDKLKALRSANAPQMTLTDLNALSSALSKDERDKLAEGIIKRNALEKQEQVLVTSAVYKAAQRGNFENIDPDLLSKSILSKNNTIGETKSIMAKLNQASPESRNLFKGDFIRNLLDEYPGGNPSASAPYTPIFDTKKFLADWESPTGKSQFAQKLEVVLGEKDAKFWYNLAKGYEGNTITDVAAKSSNLRTITSNRDITFILPIIPILSAARNRYLAAMLSTGSERYGLQAALARNALPGEVNDAYAKMFKGAFLTRQGLTALANQASSDPEFSAELQNALKEFKQKEGLDLNSN